MSVPIGAELVLVGGGHAHVEVLRIFGRSPMPGVRLTLVTRDVETPYSGMLPGLIAGHYDHDDCHIDLVRLARFAGARLIRDEAVGLDRNAGRLHCRAHPPIRYDLLSFDIGSTPRISDIPGAARHTTPVKPIDRFSDRWARILERARTRARPFRMAVIGGGAAGVELTLAMQYRLRGLAGRGEARFALLTRGCLLAGHNPAVRRTFERTLRDRGVDVHEKAEVIRVEPGTVFCADGGRVDFDEAVWATQAGAAPWLAETGLDLDDGGFIAVDASLRSTADPRIFAAGDVAAVLPHPREKAGVFAVRQGPVLAANLRRVLIGQAPRPYKPQRRFLSLISTGDRHAVASWGGLFARGAWVWRLKDRIDRAFMRRYQDLPFMPASMMPDSPDAAMAAMRCAGCGGKVAPGVLARALERLMPGQAQPEDAAVLPVSPVGVTIQTLDFFRAFTSDPHLFGRIAANHALGDVYAMGGRPTTALALACLPPGRDEIVEDDLFQMLHGALGVLKAAGAELAGGHSAEAGELALGFAVTGIVDPGHLLRKGGLRPGDRLVLTKPLGTGTLLAADMRGRAKGRWIDAALAAMQVSSGPAAACLIAHGATACTDVTGFGLLGHLLEMLEASACGARIDPDAVPALDGARETLAAGLLSTLHPGNALRLRDLGLSPDALGRPDLALLLDPQTAGGLLAGVPAERLDACLAALQGAGYGMAVAIGTVEPAAGPIPHIHFESTQSGKAG